MKKFRILAQVVGAITLGMLVVYSLLSLLGLAQLPRALASGTSQEAPYTLTPPVINYQGMLRNIDGSLINDVFTMTFRLYDDPVGGSLLHEDEIANVNVRDSLFTVLLGDTTPLDPEIFKGAIYVGVKVENDIEMVPRQRLAPAAFAVQLTDGIFVDKDGQVGIGTQDPQAQLDVNGDATVGGSATVGGDLTVAGNVGGDLTVDGNIARTGETFIGPHFLDPKVAIKSWDICPGTDYLPFDASSYIPDGATAVILEYRANANGGNGQGLLIREGEGAPAYWLAWARANGTGDENAWGGQGTFPIKDDETFQYQWYNGFNQGCELYLIGYFK